MSGALCQLFECTHPMLSVVGSFEPALLMSLANERVGARYLTY
jgi:hypothetical protein